MLLTFTNTGSIHGSPSRRKMCFVNSGPATVYWGWEAATSLGGATQGIPLTTGQGMIIDGNDNLTQPVYFACAATGTVNYTENK